MERDWKLVSTYYKLKNRIKDVRGKTCDLCIICGLEDCDHPYPKQSQVDVFETLNYFAEAILTQSKKVWFDTEREIITWPSIGSYNYKTDYIQIPALDLPFAWVHKDKYGLIGEVDGQYNSDLITFVENYLVSDGTYFGYWSGEQFYLLRAFRDGEWMKLQRFTKIPNTTDIVIEDGLRVIGFWYIPITSDALEFAKNLIKV